MSPLGGGRTDTPVSLPQKGSMLTLPHTALIFPMLFEHLNFWTSISGPRPALINGPHLSWHHVACRPCPSRQLCFRIMGALHPSPYPCNDCASLWSICQAPLSKGTTGDRAGEAIRSREALQRAIYVQCAAEFILLQLAALTDKQEYFLTDDAVSLILSHMAA